MWSLASVRGWAHATIPESPTPCPKADGVGKGNEPNRRGCPQAVVGTLPKAEAGGRVPGKVTDEVHESADGRIGDWFEKVE